MADNPKNTPAAMNAAIPTEPAAGLTPAPVVPVPEPIVTIRREDFAEQLRQRGVSRGLITAFVQHDQRIAADHDVEAQFQYRFDCFCNRPVY